MIISADRNQPTERLDEKDCVGAAAMPIKKKIVAEPVPVGLVVKKIISGFRHRKDGDLGLILDVWPEAVGHAIAANTRPARLAGDVLWVHVDSSVWIQELRFLKTDIVDSLNARLEGTVVTDLKFKIGKA